MLRAEDCGGRLPEEPQVTGRCGYVDDVGVERLIDSAASVAAIRSVWRVSCDKSTLLLRWRCNCGCVEVTGDGAVQRSREAHPRTVCTMPLRDEGLRLNYS
jgi:hypothetical protein